VCCVAAGAIWGMGFATHLRSGSEILTNRGVLGRCLHGPTSNAPASAPHTRTNPQVLLAADQQQKRTYTPPLARAERSWSLLNRRWVSASMNFCLGQAQARARYTATRNWGRWPCCGAGRWLQLPQPQPTCVVSGLRSGSGSSS
jgi:hypothetical protein